MTVNQKFYPSSQGHVYKYPKGHKTRKVKIFSVDFNVSKNKRFNIIPNTRGYAKLARDWVNWVS